MPTALRRAVPCETGRWASDDDASDEVRRVARFLASEYPREWAGAALEDTAALTIRLLRRLQRVESTVDRWCRTGHDATTLASAGHSLRAILDGRD
jgi:hypothetical protein